MALLLVNRYVFLGQAGTLSQLCPACLGVWGTRRESRSGVFQFMRGLVLFPLKFLGPLVVSAGTPLDVYLSYNCSVDS